MRDQAIVGYVRLTMRSERITHLYARGLRNLLLVALVGLLAVGGAGVLLHVQLSRRSEALARALAAAVRGEAATPRQSATSSPAPSTWRGRSAASSTRRAASASRRSSAWTR